MKKTKKVVPKLISILLAVLVIVFVTGQVHAQGSGQDSAKVTWYVSYDGSYEYVRGPTLSEVGKIILILLIISTYVGYRLWRRSRETAVG